MYQVINMRIKKIVILSLLVSTSLFSQKNSDVLFKIDGEPVFVSEFKRVYEKNLDVLSDDKQKGVHNYLDLFIKYKLKLKEAYRLQLDTTRAYKREIETYKNQLIAPYLLDTVFISKLVKDAYHRTKFTVNASHILVKIPKGVLPKDTLQFYTKISKAREEVLSGVSFSKVALKYSDDQSVKDNFGNLGSFTAFKMVYPFENAAYRTKVGGISKPFRTRFGYHFVKVNDLQLSAGEIEVAHILITDKSLKGKIVIDSIYKGLMKGADFNTLVLKYSNDKNSVSSKGKLPKFGIGRMPKPFEDHAFEIKKENEITKPFKTRFGWHIIKLLKKFPVTSFAEMKTELTKKVKASGGARMSDLVVLNKLKNKYQILVNEKAKEFFNRKGIRGLKKDILQQTLLSINKKKIRQDVFFDYIRNRRHKSIAVLFNEFRDQEVLNYFKENLKFTEPEFAKTLKEYEDGIVVFDLMQQKIWQKSTSDTLGLQEYFSNHKSDYNFTELKDNKGKVMSDYQTFLENELMNSLQQKYKVTIRKRVIKKLVKQYHSNE